jgi:glycolate oxidase iron-sulfur subunit
VYPEFQHIDREADKCVKCGLCVPYCPTYLLEQNENESPRGRIALMQGLAAGRLPVTSALETHLNHCLACRACERACPADVRFGSMLDQTRQVLRRIHPLPPTTRFGLWLVAHAGAWRCVEGLVALSRSTGLLRWFQTSRLLKRLGLARLQRRAQLIAPTHHLAARLSPSPTRRGRVALFSGCMGTLLDASTRQAVVRVLDHLGFDVVVPSHHHCCGALHQHNGDMQTTLALAKKNLYLFQQLQVDKIVFLASGCGAQLVDYGALPWGDASLGQRATEFVGKVCDATALIAQTINELDIKLKPLDKTVAVHEPCSQRNVLRGSGHVYTLLERIPALRIQPLADNMHCCGAAGSYVLTQPDKADALLKVKLTPWLATPTDIIVSDNVGCRVHLQKGLRAAGHTVKVLHPLELVYRQLEQG